MKLSTITTPITAQTVKSIMSATTGNAVKNRNLIRQETAKANGFDSIEQAETYFNREERIKNNLWVERNLDGNIVIKSKNIHLLIYPKNIVIYDVFKDEVSMKDLPIEFQHTNYSDSDISFDYKNKEITLQNKNKSFKIVVEKTSELGFIMSFFYLGSPLTDFTVYLNYSDFASNSNPIADEQESQVTRLMAEIAMTCEYDIKPFLSDYGLTDNDAKNIIDTALYLNELSKGYDKVGCFEDKPAKMFPQAMGCLATIFLENAYLEDKLGSQNRKHLFDSMSIFDENEFENFRAMAKNSSDWFRFSYC